MIFSCLDGLAWIVHFGCIDTLLERLSATAANI